MAISEYAKKKHDELFPGHVSTVAVTDPELIEIYDNFAFDEVLRLTKLDIRTRLMVQLASIIACQAVREYRIMLGAALNVGVTPVAAKEILYQAVPYIGMARAFDFIQATNDVLIERGVKLPLPGQSTTTPATRAEKGLAVQKQIIGADTVDKLYNSSPADLMHIQHFCRPTALAITTRAPASTFRRASCSPSVCSSPLADVMLRSRAMSPQTSTSATNARG